MSDEILFQWTKNGVKDQKIVDKESVMAVFKGVAEGFVDDNEISMILINEIIPDVKSIEVPYDINETQDVPVIHCIMEKKENDRVIKILRYHKIVWSILNKYCS